MLDWLIDKLCKPGSTVWGNCFYAFLLFRKHGGAIIILRSESHEKIPHVSWAQELSPTLVRHLIPIKRRNGWLAYFFAPFFKGKWVQQVIPKGADREASDATLDTYKRKVT